jgi:hypothetical protein
VYVDYDRTLHWRANKNLKIRTKERFEKAKEPKKFKCWGVFQNNNNKITKSRSKQNKDALPKQLKWNIKEI